MKNTDIVKLICDTLNKPYSLITHVPDRKGHDRRYAIDYSKIRDELGWKPETDFYDGIRKTIEWYLNHRDWWQTVLNGEYREMYGNELK